MRQWSMMTITSKACNRRSVPLLRPRSKSLLVTFDCASSERVYPRCIIGATLRHWAQRGAAVCILRSSHYPIQAPRMATESLTYEHAMPRISPGGQCLRHYWCGATSWRREAGGWQSRNVSSTQLAAHPLVAELASLAMPGCSMCAR